MPLSRSWVEEETEGLTGKDRDVARFALVVAKSAQQMDEGLVKKILGEQKNEEKFIRTLAWAAFSGARRTASRIADKISEAVYA